MATNIKEFSKELVDFGNKLLPEQYVLFQKKIAFQLLAGTVKRTPVDTGRARGNWQISIDVIVTAEVDRADKDGSTTNAEGAGKLAMLVPGRYQIVYLINNLPYIEALENGHSNQAPAGMLALTIAEIETQFQ